MTNRRTFVSFVAGAIAAGKARAAFGQSLTKISVATPPTDGAKALLWGVHNGVFKKYGLDVEVIPIGSGAAALAALAGGSAQVAFGNILSIASGYTRGVPFEIVAPGDIYTSERPYMLLFVKKDSEIRTGKDLSNKAIAGPALRDLTTMATLAWIDQTGGDSKTVRALEFPASAAMGALDTARVDAATLSSPFLDAAVDSGKYRVIGKPYDAIAKRFVIASWVANAPVVAKDPQTYARFGQAFRESSVYTNSHLADTVDLVSQFTKIDPQVIAHGTRILDAEYLAKTDIQPVIDFSAKNGLIERSFDAAAIISPAIRPPR
jgi:NitT/TauT family transport system substrate-binding protein